MAMGQEKGQAQKGKHTKRLLDECSSGCKMALESINQIQQYVKDEKLKEVIEKYDDEHKTLQMRCMELLVSEGGEGKDPNPMAEMFSRVSTEMKMMVKDTGTQIAKILMDGCNMGVQSITEHIHQYSEASTEAKDIAKDLVKCEERFADEMKQFL